MLKVECNLKIDLPFLYRKANFRYSSHALMIETGKHLYIDRHVRFCKLCLKKNVRGLSQ